LDLIAVIDAKGEMICSFHGDENWPGVLQNGAGNREDFFAARAIAAAAPKEKGGLDARPAGWAVKANAVVHGFDSR
jgi:hypothetical protein